MLPVSDLAQPLRYEFPYPELWSTDGSRLGSILKNTFWRTHFWMPLAAFLILSAVLLGLHGDQWIADRIYALEGNAWTLQSAYLSQDILHAAGRQASKNAWFVVLIFCVGSFLTNRLRTWRLPLVYVLVASLLSTAVVGLLKRHTNIDCPWDLLRYGGEHAYYGLFAQRPTELGRAACFPAGHASAGYAWIALYFFALSTRPEWRWWMLGSALALGMLFGSAQQLRGAHFMSHDVWTLMICWLVALGLYVLMLAPRRGQTSMGRAS